MATVAEIVTSEIIKRLEAGVVPWRKTWSGGEAVNYITQKPYTGINRLLLDGGEYLTYKQIQDKHGKIKKGAKSHIVVFYKPLEIKDDETDEIIIKRLLRYYRVYSITDVEGIPSKQVIKERPNYSIENCQKIIDDYVAKSGIRFIETTSTHAYYRPSDDTVCVPRKGQFDNSQAYYATAYHELTHSTGAANRLNRITSTAHFGNAEYSREELTAEIGSAILCSHTGIDTDSNMDNSAAYIQSWLKALRNDRNMVLVAAAKAEKAVDYILN